MKKIHLGISMIEVLISLSIISLVLLSLLAYQITAIKSIEQTRYQTIASAQLMNFSDMLLANQKNSLRTNAFNAWNKDNENLLPKGEGEFNEIADHQCEINVNWFFKKPATESMVVFC